MASVFSAFRVVAAATAAWFLVLLTAAGLVFGALGDSGGAFWTNTSLMAALAVLSGPLLLREVRWSVPGRERGEWTGTELLYAIVFCISLFIFLNSVAYLFFTC